MRSRTWGLPLWLTLLWVGASMPLAAQEQDRDVFGGSLRRAALTPYVNYAEYPYKPYRRQLRQDVSYNFFGDFLADGFTAFRLQEQRPGTSLIAKDEAFRSFFNNLVIASTSYGRINAALTVGDEIRSVLTPFTLQMAGLNGMRWELEVPNNRITVLVARGFDNTDFPGYESFSTPVRIVANENWSTNRQIIRREANPVYTMGGHWATDVGDVLTLGGTLLNQHQMNAVADTKGSFLHGSIPYPDMLPPDALMLRFTDDSPDDGRAGAAVYAVSVEIEGTAGGRDTLLTSRPDSPNFSLDLVPVRSGGLRVAGHWEANGDDELVYTFSLPADVTPRRARYSVVLANDYRVAVSQSHHVSRTNQRTTPFFTVDRAPGNITDLSNRTGRTYEHGLNSGQTLLGLDFTADLVGLKLRGAVVLNSLHRRFPVQEGHSVTDGSSAWYINAVKTFPRLRGLRFMGELFHVGPRYSGDYDSRRGGLVLYTDRAGGGSESVVAEYPLVEDNDDHDRYADDNLNDYPDATTLEAGVYPGLDKDNDNIPDEDRNANGVPDYQEPFLLYYSDPQEFVYGLDLNNNGVIDERENDNRPDYPYDRDRAGHHVAAAIEPLPGVEAACGRYRVESIAAGQRAVSTYVRAMADLEQPRWGHLQLAHDSKRVRDNLPDPVYVYDPEEKTTPLDDPAPDLLQQQDSWVHTSFLGTRTTPWRSLHIENNGKVVCNRSYDLPHTVADEDDRRTTLTLVSKVDWRGQWGPLVVRPMYKRMWQRQTLASRRLPLVSHIQSAPILRLDYRLTDALLLQFGQQGFNWLGLGRPFAFRSIDKVDPFRSYSTTDSIFMFTLEGAYLGNVITTNTGVHWQRKSYDDPNAGGDQRYTRFFVDVVAGLDRY
jgi:hypothetical protein